MSSTVLSLHSCEFINDNRLWDSWSYPSRSSIWKASHYDDRSMTTSVCSLLCHPGVHMYSPAFSAGSWNFLAWCAPTGGAPNTQGKGWSCILYQIAEHLCSSGCTSHNCKQCRTCHQQYQYQLCSIDEKSKLIWTWHYQWLHYGLEQEVA